VSEDEFEAALLRFRAGVIVSLATKLNLSADFGEVHRMVAREDDTAVFRKVERRSLDSSPWRTAFRWVSKMHFQRNNSS
jgi:hypothetical protein